MKLLAVDLDGTLLRRDGQVDERDREAIARLQARGVAVTIVTGRLFAGTRDIATELQIRSPIACAGGAQLVDPRDGTELEHHGIVTAAAEQLRRALAPRAVSTFVLYRDSVFYDARGAAFIRYVRAWSPVLDQVDKLYEHACWGSARGISGVVVIGVPDDVSAAAEELREGGRLEVLEFEVTRTPRGRAVPPMRALLVHAKGVSKGTAIVWLAEQCGCRTQEVVAIGDWRNDVEMFAAAGRSFVMAHAPAEVKRFATDRLIADARSGGGVAEAVARVWPPAGGQSKPTG